MDTGSEREHRVIHSMTPQWNAFATRANRELGIRIGCVTFADQRSTSIGIGGEALVSKGSLCAWFFLLLLLLVVVVIVSAETHTPSVSLFNIRFYIPFYLPS